VLIRPAEGEITSRLPAFEWTGVTGASSYRIQISGRSDFSTLITNRSLTTTTYLSETTLDAGRTYFWRVRASYPSGSVTAYSDVRSFTAGDANPFTAGSYEQGNNKFTWTGTWATINNASASGGSYRETHDTSATVTFTFTGGTTLTIYRMLGSNRGPMQVCVDGACQTFDGSSASTLYQQPLVFNVSDPNAIHRVEIRNTSSSYIDLDAIRVQ
jgi:hypothetical protein